MVLEYELTSMSAIESGDEVVSSSELKRLNKKVRDLEQMLRPKTIEAEKF
jgi:transposase